MPVSLFILVFTLIINLVLRFIIVPTNLFHILFPVSIHYIFFCLYRIFCLMFFFLYYSFIYLFYSIFVSSNLFRIVSYLLFFIVFVHLFLFFFVSASCFFSFICVCSFIYFMYDSSFLCLHYLFHILLYICLFIN